MSTELGVQDSGTATEAEMVIAIADDEGTGTSYDTISLRSIEIRTSLNTTEILLSVSDSATDVSSETVHPQSEDLTAIDESASVSIPQIRDYGSGSNSISSAEAHLSPSDSATGLSDHGLTIESDDAFSSSSSEELYGERTDLGTMLYRVAIDMSSSDTNRGFLDRQFPYIVAKEEGTSSARSTVSMQSSDSSPFSSNVSYFEKHEQDAGYGAEAIYWGTLLSKFDADGGRLRTFGNVLVMRILGAVPGATVYHETLNALAKMIQLMVRSLTGYFYAPQHDTAACEERWRGASQYEQDGHLVENVVSISIGDTDFGAMSESQSVTKY